MTFTMRSDVTAMLDTTNLAGSDAAICRAARVSTLGSAAAETEGTYGLINYLMKDRHGSPFEHASMTFLIEAPIFVAREFMRHRVGWSYNETSGRYKELAPVFYVPPVERNLVQRGKPGKYEFFEGTADQYATVYGAHEDAYSITWSAYQTMLGAGIAREVARSVLPVGTFTAFYATCNPRSLMHFLSLRTKAEGAAYPSFPQREIEQVAEQMETAFAQHFPLTYTSFVHAGRVAP